VQEIRKTQAESVLCEVAASSWVLICGRIYTAAVGHQILWIWLCIVDEGDYCLLVT